MPSLTNQVSYNLCVVEDLFYGQPNNDDTEVKFIKLIVESDDYQRVAHSVTVLTPSPVIIIQLSLIWGSYPVHPHKEPLTLVKKMKCLINFGVLKRLRVMLLKSFLLIYSAMST
ncbi:uncharacterized protein LOC114293482 [Camellia sinensis]|uniref:uncharacterized protein LOC114293482 n=1 Tax=Camellia sinensis TaxID=4442 RepID=UPI001036EEE5|nr:uncharacterized protein LOC114293482 [Camellia sinensis]